MESTHAPSTAPPAAAASDAAATGKKRRNRRPRPPLPDAPEGVAMMTRTEAAAFLGTNINTFTVWETAGRISIPRYRLPGPPGLTILYAADDLARLREEFSKIGKPYPDPERPGCYRVPIGTHKGYLEAIIDAEDLPKIAGKRLQYVSHNDETRPRQCVVVCGPQGRMTLLKRIIAGVQGQNVGVNVTHANGDALDCRRANLVVRNGAQRTRRGYKFKHRCGRPTTSRYKGVSWFEARGAWHAKIRCLDATTHLGYFDCEEDAAEAYDEAARRLFGAHARLNFPRPGELPTALAPPAPVTATPTFIPRYTTKRRAA